MKNSCPILGPRCDFCDCAGRACQSHFPGNVHVSFIVFLRMAEQKKKSISTHDNRTISLTYYTVDLISTRF